MMATNNVIRIGAVGKSPISVGRYTYGFENVSISHYGEGARLNIGSFCSLASSITIFLGGDHRTDWITTFPFGHIYQDELDGTGIEGHPRSRGDVNIGDDVWIGHGVTIMSGVSIGSGAVLAANAHVVRDVGPYEIVGGNPAKLLKKRFDDDVIASLLRLQWWNLPLEVIRQINRDLSSPPSAQVLDELFKYRG